MGEAKRRQDRKLGNADPISGQRTTKAERPTKAFRGLVVTSIKPAGDQGFSVSGLDSQELRHALLFWDKIAWPNSNLVRVESGPDEQFLEMEGAMERPDVRLNMSGDFNALLDLAHAVAFEQLERDAPGCWTLGQGLDATLKARGFLVQNQGLSVQLSNAVPVPDKEVPLAEILDFKLRRKDQLDRFRGEMDRLQEAINTSPDPEEEIKKCIEQIDKACADMIRVGQEWRFPVRLTDVKSSFEFRPIQAISHSAAAFMLASANHLSATSQALAAVGGAFSAMAPAWKLTPDFGWRGLRVRPSPYRYVSSYHRELF